MCAPPQAAHSSSRSCCPSGSASTEDRPIGPCCLAHNAPILSPDNQLSVEHAPFDIAPAGVAPRPEFASVMQRQEAGIPFHLRDRAIAFRQILV